MTQNKLVLLIEDDESLLYSTKDFLEEEGFSVICASDGMEGVQKALTRHPDIILADISLPKLDGYQIYKTLQENQNTMFIPFIFITAKSSAEDIRAGMQLGADDYITKPYDYEELLTTINTRIEKQEKLFSSSNDKYNALLENTLAGVFIIDENYKLVFYNSKFLKLFDYEEREINKIAFTDLFIPNDKEKIESKSRKLFRGIQNHFSLQCTGIDRKQKQIPVSVYAGQSFIKGKSMLIGNILKEDAILSKEKDNHKFSKDNYDEHEMSNAVEYILKHKELISPTQTKQLKILSKKPKTSSEPEIKLTNREKEVLQYICEGYTNQEIGEKLFISQRTVDGHRSNLMDKTYTRNTAELVTFAIKHELVNV